ncbi:TRAP transporter substrate-binding protein [uncultured Propionivibrio sp.]|uniref:TRAP transporter substrate-binding protein n=1 Tax=uncultured Propionivibrio sp. TaxID=426737 RepID=UPI0029C0C0DA|nr:TRAP transporter substrate-binding protein [uncultured Propionivibrio sp.]
MKLKNALIASLAAVGLLAATIGSAQAQMVLRFASEAARSDPQTAGGEKMNELLKAKTGGAMEVKVFSDSALGHAQAAISSARGGSIDIVISGSSNYTGIVPLLGVFDIPFIFKDTAHAYRTLDGKVGQDIMDKLAEFNLKGLAYWDTGWRELTNSRGPVNSPADVKGLKVRTNGSPAHNETWKLLGANPVPMPIGELYTALEMKTVDAQEQSLGLLYSGKFYEVQKYLSLTNHAYSALLVAMNKQKFDSLTPAQQKAVIEAAQEAGNYQRKLNNDNVAKIIAEVKKAGLQVIEKVDPQPFFEASKPVRQMFTSKYGGEDYIKAIDAIRDAK